MSTVVITGTSSGIGRAAALNFARRGWKVFACMREAEKKKTLFEGIQGIETVDMDVECAESIEKAFSYISKTSVPIDVLVNNAGYGLNGPFEAASPEQIQRQYNVNVFGLMNVTRAFLPFFRKQGHGTIVNVSSVAGRTAFPFSSLYISTKWAVEGFSEALYFELRQFGIMIKLVEPGTVKTDFFGRSMDFARGEAFEAYRLSYENRTKTAKGGRGTATPEQIAEVIYKAAEDKSGRLRYTAGIMAAVILMLRKLLPERLFYRLVGMVKK